MLYNAFQSARHPKSAPSCGGIYIPCNTCSLGPPGSASQTASRSVQPFATQPTAESPYTLQCALKYD